MIDETQEDKLIRSMDEIDARIQAFRERVRTLLTDIESRRKQPAETGTATKAA